MQSCRFLTRLYLLHRRAERFMKYAVYLFICLLAFTGTVQSAGAQGLLSRENISFELFVNDRFHVINEFFDSGRRKFNQDYNLHVLYLNPSMTAQLGSHLVGVFELESEFLFDIDDDHLDDDINVRNAYLQAMVPGLDWTNVTAGRLAFRTVDGLIYDDEAPAIRLQADLERAISWPLKFRVIAAEVDNDSPYIHAELTYAFSFLESITLYYGWFRDTNDGIARIFNFFEDERVYESRGKIQWFGLSLRTFIGSVLMRTTCVYERGSVRLRHEENGRTSMEMRGYLIDVNFDYNFTKDFSGSLFMFVASGDKKPLKGTFRSFVSIDPFIDKTNIFFNGGIDSQFSSDNVGLNGVQLPGVMAPGLSLTYRIGSKALLKCVYAYLLTHNGTDGQGHTYGWEFDITGYYNLRSNLQLFAEFNLFDPADYFKRLTNHRDHVSTEFIVGISYFFSN